MTCTALQLAQLLNAEIIGPHDLTITDAQPLDFAEGKHVSFVGEAKHFKVLRKSLAGAVLLPHSLKEEIPADELTKRTFLLVDEVLDQFIEAIQYFRPQRTLPDIGISSRAIVAESASVGANTHIYPNATVGEEVVIGENCRIMSGAVIGDGCRLGDNTTIYPNAVLYHDVILGDNVIIHSNAVIGADGFGYRLQEGRHVRIPQLGTVRIENDVEIGAGSTVDRAMAGETIIGEGTKIDNLVMIAHNCRIGKHNVFASQVGFAGSSTSGNYVVCAGQVGIADHVHLGEGSVYGAKSGVNSSKEGGKTYLGAPAERIDLAIKAAKVVSRLPELRQQVRRLAKQVEQLEAEQQKTAASEVDAA
ncbi:UDP-3-O-acylglucosamine N-acyltransferase [Polystyrenella longa]|uniref:UDP-3-O-acylglucosamine N-acyltransferase n=1 Tax=Polystyrenella longa TaxID=2528007 RepID=A0A518CKR1_9PLAN|nr:UDP-3-O-(3-hydroxymyristoyl)glucosamine N-acyltransferase [Polystyrenella longa]QDU79808.1 UDP-3-O-acylglucosamine N-acyltransferase [Polystyrenella longa]